MKEKLIIKYIKNYLKYYEKNTNKEESLIFYMIRIRIERIENLSDQKLKTLNETIKKQLEG